MARILVADDEAGIREFAIDTLALDADPKGVLGPL